MEEGGVKKNINGGKEERQAGRKDGKKEIGSKEAASVT